MESSSDPPWRVQGGDSTSAASSRPSSNASHSPPGRVQSKLVNARNVVDAILGQAEDHDLIVLGCHQHGRKLSLGRVDYVGITILEKAHCPVMLVPFADEDAPGAG